MGNLLGVMSHCHDRSQEVLLGDQSHIHIYEQGGLAQVISNEIATKFKFNWKVKMAKLLKFLQNQYAIICLCFFFISSMHMLTQERLQLGQMEHFV